MDFSGIILTVHIVELLCFSHQAGHPASTPSRGWDDVLKLSYVDLL